VERGKEGERFSFIPSAKADGNRYYDDSAGKQGVRELLSSMLQVEGRYSKRVVYR
jgi:hypothetical protein